MIDPEEITRQAQQLGQSIKAIDDRAGSLCVIIEAKNMALDDLLPMMQKLAAIQREASAGIDAALAILQAA